MIRFPLLSRSSPLQAPTRLKRPILPKQQVAQSGMLSYREWYCVRNKFFCSAHNASGRSLWRLRCALAAILRHFDKQRLMKLLIDLGNSGIGLGNKIVTARLSLPSPPLSEISV